VTAEGHVRFIEHKGVRILQIDLENCTAAEVVERTGQVRSVIATQPVNSVRTLTLVKGARFDRKTAAALKDYTAHNKPFVRVAAIVGVSGLQEVVFNVIVRVTGRKIAMFSNAAEAKEFLASDVLGASK
jgi:hypothetical protein